jgi:hypothetical protein
MANRAQQWEHCRLFLVAARFPKDPTSTPHQVALADTEAHYHLQVVYMGPDGKYVERQLAAFDHPLAENPFYKAVGLLGGAGWELVWVEGGRHYSWTDSEGGEPIPYRIGASPTTTMAYFKRPVVVGRPADHPPLTL